MKEAWNLEQDRSIVVFLNVDKLGDFRSMFICDEMSFIDLVQIVECFFFF